MSNDDEKTPLNWIVGGYYFNDTASDRSTVITDRSYVTATAPAGQQYYPFGFSYLPSGTGFNQTAAGDTFSANQQKHARSRPMANCSTPCLTS